MKTHARISANAEKAVSSSHPMFGCGGDWLGFVSANLSAQIISSLRQTIALVDHPGISPQFHYDQGFEVFIRLFEKGNPTKGLGTEAEFVLKE